MSGKRNSRAGEKPKDKYNEQTMFVVQKMTVLDMLSTEISISAVGRHYGVTESMIRHVTKSEDKHSVCVCVCVCVLRPVLQRMRNFLV
jgi:hypothetical protein